MKKTWLAICLLLILALTLTACNNDEQPKDETGTPAVSNSESVGDSATEAPTEEESYNYDELDTDNDWTKPY